MAKDPARATVDITRRPVLTSFENYADAQKAVDTLSDQRFPVQHVAIVGVDLKLVESVLGRMSWGRAALGGMATFAWFGVLVGLFVSLFGGNNVSATQLVLLGLIFGAGFGIVFGLVSYAFTGGKRDFVSRQALQATRYDVLCDSSVIGEARRILGLVPAWPPEPPVPATAPGPAEPPAPDVAAGPVAQGTPGPWPPPGSPKTQTPGEESGGA